MSELKILNVPLYGFSEADHLAAVSYGTSRRWLVGYRYRDRTGKRVQRPPVTKRKSGPDEGSVSFLDLVEVAAIGGLRKLGFTLPQIREAVDACQDLLRVERPLTSLEFKTGGREIFVSSPSGELIELLGKKGRQAWLEVLAPFLANLDYQDQVARRWWPLGKQVPIVVDPRYAHGLPVVRKSGVRTEILFERFQAGELQDEIAEDFNLDPLEVERAIQFEAIRLKAA